VSWHVVVGGGKELSAGRSTLGADRYKIQNCQYRNDSNEQGGGGCGWVGCDVQDFPSEVMAREWSKPKGCARCWREGGHCAALAQLRSVGRMVGDLLVGGGDMRSGTVSYPRVGSKSEGNLEEMILLQSQPKLQ